MTFTDQELQDLLECLYETLDSMEVIDWSQPIVRRWARLYNKLVGSESYEIPKEYTD